MGPNKDANLLSAQGGQRLWSLAQELVQGGAGTCFLAKLCRGAQAWVHRHIRLKIHMFSYRIEPRWVYFFCLFEDYILFLLRYLLHNNLFKMVFFKPLESRVSSVAKVVGGGPCKLGRGRGALTPIGPEKIICILFCISDFHVMNEVGNQ